MMMNFLYKTRLLTSFMFGFNSRNNSRLAQVHDYTALSEFFERTKATTIDFTSSNLLAKSMTSAGESSGRCAPRPATLQVIF